MPCYLVGYDGTVPPQLLADEKRYMADDAKLYLECLSGKILAERVNGTDGEKRDGIIFFSIYLQCRKIPERIVAAAIQCRCDGKVYTASRHHQVIEKLHYLSYQKPYGQQGFVTDRGRFVDRVEAAEIAVKAGQIEKLKYGNRLFSEWVLPLEKV